MSLPSYTSDDLSLISSSVRNRWPTSDEARKRVLENVLRIGADPLTTPMAAVAALKVLVDIDRLELEAIRTLSELSATTQAVSDELPPVTDQKLAANVRALLEQQPVLTLAPTGTDQ